MRNRFAYRAPRNNFVAGVFYFKKLEPNIIPKKLCTGWEENPFYGII